MATKPRKPMYDWQIKPKRKRYVAEGKCIDCGKDSQTYRCNSCNERQTNSARVYRENNRELLREKARAWAKTHPDRVRTMNKKRRANSYDMTVEEYEMAVSEPCGICGTTERKRGIDHCHVTNEVRGSLCMGCNASLGWYEKNGVAIEKWLNK